MTDANATTRTLLVERVMPHPPEKVWRALTQGHLLEAWLMKNDFQPVVGHKFNFRADPMPHWNGITDCEVLVIEPNKRLAYSWNASGDEAATGMKTIVTWTLTAAGNGGTHVRMEQSGFRPGPDDRFYVGANYGWRKMLEGLERVTAGLP
ncbi:SRPBCC family protein [Bradyrhizobium sp.]|uniref:SRPBCC family protein n=1 Tax=Bradyrhizobium sp. TaxID=376 RepID=UPI003C71C7B0